MATSTLERSDVSAADPRTGKPLQTFRHRNISASVFENESKASGTFLSVSLQRAYKDANDEYQHSSSFTRDELPVVRYLLDQAWEYMLKAEVK